MVMSLFASGASSVASAASAAVPASPNARAAAVLKSVSFDLIEGLLTPDLGGIRARQAYLSPANGNRERVGWNGVPIDDEKVIILWAGSRLFDNALGRPWIWAEKRRPLGAFACDRSPLQICCSREMNSGELPQCKNRPKKRGLGGQSDECDVAGCSLRGNVRADRRRQGSL